MSDIPVLFAFSVKNLSPQCALTFVSFFLIQGSSPCIIIIKLRMHWQDSSHSEFGLKSEGTCVTFPAKSALIDLSPNLSNFLLQGKYESLMPLLWLTLSGVAKVPATLCRIEEPWRQRSPWSEWVAWCWPNRTVATESYAARFAMVTTDSPRLDSQPFSERARVMHLLADSRSRMDPEGSDQRGRGGGGLGQPDGCL